MSAMLQEEIFPIKRDEDISVVNTSGLRPRGHAVLVRPYEPELEQAKESKIVIPDNVMQSQRSVDQRATVIEVGPVAWKNEPEPRAKPGDKVLISKFSGWLSGVRKDGYTYRVVNDADIFCIIEDE